MAVIREQRQFGVGNIGVVRASKAAEQSAVNTMDVADKIIGMAFKHASNEAEIKGKNLAESISDSNIRTIDPNTGMPKAMELSPSGFGTIATQAYNNVIDDRYKISIDQEIKTKASELALESERQSDPVSYYSEQMGDYLDQMTSNVSGKYKSYLDQTGASYLASTKLNLQERVIIRDRQVAGTEILAGLETDLPVILGMATSGASDTEVELALNAQIQRIEDAFSSRSITAEARKAALQTINNVIPLSNAQSITNNKDISSTTLLKIIDAVDNGGATVGEVPQEYREVAEKLIGSAKTQDQRDLVIGNIKNEINLRNSLVNQTAAEVEQTNLANSPKLFQELNDGTLKNSDLGFKLGLTSNLQDIQNAVTNAEQEREKLLQRTRANGDLTPAQATQAYNALIQSIAEGTIVAIASSKNVDALELNAVSTWFQSNGQITKGLSQETLSKLQVLKDANVLTTENRNDFVSVVTSLQQDANFYETKVKQANDDENKTNETLALLNHRNNTINKAQVILDGFNLDPSQDNFTNALNQTNLLTQGSEESGAKLGLTASSLITTTETIQKQFVESWVNNLTNADKTYTLNGEEVTMSSSMMSYISQALVSEDMSRVPDELKPQIEQLKKSFNQEVMDAGRTRASTRAGNLSNQESQSKTQTNIANATNSVNNNTGTDNANTKQVVINTVFNSNNVPETFFRTPNSLANLGTPNASPASTSLIQMAAGNRRFPESFISDLSFLSSGGNVQGSENLIVWYSKLRNYINPETGLKDNLFASTISKTLSKAEMANLDIVVANLNLRGNVEVKQDGTVGYNQDALNQELTKINQSQSDSKLSIQRRKDILVEMRGKDKNIQAIDDWLYKQVSGSASAFNELSPYVNGLVNSGANLTQITKLFENLYEDQYPETEGFIIDTGLKSTTNSRFALNKVTTSNSEKQSFLSAVESDLIGLGLTIYGESGLPTGNERQGTLTDLVLQKTVGSFFTEAIRGNYSQTQNFNRAYLMPLPNTSPFNPAYQIVKINNQGEIEPVFITNDDGEEEILVHRIR